MFISMHILIDSNIEMRNLWDLLPTDLKNYIFGYGPGHYEKYMDVMDELYEYMNLTICGNDMCEKEIYIYNSIETTILGRTCYFCDNDHCAGYGEWSIRYDYRKSRRGR